jgi:protein SCO1/2
VRRPAVKSLLCLALLCGPALVAVDHLPAELEGVGITEKTGEQVDLNLTFTAENGYPVALRQFFRKDRPVVLTLVYYSCPMLCNLVLNGQTSALREVPWTPGEEYEAVTISIDPAETFNLAREKKLVYLERYGRPAAGWHFLTDQAGNVKKLAAQVGFQYKYDERIRQYAHAAAMIVLTPDGKVSRYLYGIKFNPRDVRLALTEASQSKFKFSVEQLLLFCYHYDPQARGYVLFATNIMRAGGVLVMLILGSALYRLWRRERRRPSASNDPVHAQ